MADGNGRMYGMHMKVGREWDGWYYKKGILIITLAIEIYTNDSIA